MACSTIGKRIISSSIFTFFFIIFLIGTPSPLFSIDIEFSLDYNNDGDAKINFFGYTIYDEEQIKKDAQQIEALTQNTPQLQRQTQGLDILMQKREQDIAHTELATAQTDYNVKTKKEALRREQLIIAKKLQEHRKNHAQ